MKLSQRVERLKPSPTMALNQTAKELIAQGKSVVNLTLGEPDFQTPDRIKAAAVAAIQKGATKYTVASGIPELKDAILAKTKKDTGRTYKRTEVIVSVGAKQALFNLCLALLEPGDEAVVIAPYWVSYTEMIEFAGAKSVVVQTNEKDGFVPALDLVEKSLNARTKLLLLNSPCNPTGAVYSRETIEGIAALAKKWPQLTVATDDIYERLVFDSKGFFSIAQVPSFPAAQLVLVSGVSKSYAMTGWRIGYAVGPEPLISAMGAVQSQSTSNPASISQWAAVEALSGDQSDVSAMRTEYARRRDHLLERFKKIPKVSCFRSEGAFYLFPNVQAYLGGTMATDFHLAKYLLEEHGLALVPGSDFGAPGFLRLTYSASIQELDEGMNRLERGLSALR